MGLPVSRRAAARAAPESSLDSRERGLLRSPPTLGNPPGGGRAGLREGGSSYLLQSPLLIHIFEIYGKAFGLSQRAGGTGGWPGRAVRRSQGFNYPRKAVGKG